MAETRIRVRHINEAEAAVLRRFAGEGRGFGIHSAEIEAAAQQLAEQMKITEEAVMAMINDLQVEPTLPINGGRNSFKGWLQTAKVDEFSYSGTATPRCLWYECQWFVSITAIGQQELALHATKSTATPSPDS